MSRSLLPTNVQQIVGGFSNGYFQTRGVSFLNLSISSLAFSPFQGRCSTIQRGLYPGAILSSSARRGSHFSSSGEIDLV